MSNGWSKSRAFPTVWMITGTKLPMEKEDSYHSNKKRMRPVRVASSYQFQGSSLNNRENCGNYRICASWRSVGNRFIKELPPEKICVRLWLYQPHPDTNGISHGLKTCHRHVFLTAFRFPYSKKKTSYESRRFFFLVNYGARNTNTMP